MKLHFKNYSTCGEPLFILHGLFGSLTNWNWHSKQFSEQFSVYGVDLRNHGESPHNDTLNYDVMAQDVVHLFDVLGIESAFIIGHSMGGKVAMELALRWPEYVNKLIIVDISPVSYPNSGDGHLGVIEGMNALKLNSIKSRGEAESFLENYIDDQVTRKFILTNLTSSGGSGFRWRLNLESIEKNYARLREKPSTSGVFEKPVLFVKGALSNYIRSEYEQETLSFFPNSRVKLIMGAGHWLHAEKPQTFQKIAVDFLTKGYS